MDEFDASLTVLQIKARNDDAVSALKLPQNANFLVKPANLERKIAAPRRKREGTPLVKSQSVLAVLRIDRLPYDATRGWVFGRYDDGREENIGEGHGKEADEEDEGVDFVLGTVHQGVSKRHFSIDYNWEAKTLLLKNLSDNGTVWIDPETGTEERIFSSRALLGTINYSFSAGTVDLVLQVPPRDDIQQAKYNVEFERLRTEAYKAVPKMHGLEVAPIAEETPLVIGKKFKRGRAIGRGATAVVYEVTNYETGDRLAAKSYSYTGQTEAVLKSMTLEIRLLQKLKHVCKIPDELLRSHFDAS